MNGALFFIFNVLFISFGQSILLFLITTPAYVMVLASRLLPETSNIDIIFPRVILFLVLLEFAADQQQWSKSPIYPRDQLFINNPYLQTSNSQRNIIKRLPNSLLNSIKKIWTADSLSPACGHGAATPTLQQSKPFGSLYTSGAVGPLTLCTTGHWSVPSLT